MPEYRIQAGDLIELYINDSFPAGRRKTVQKAAPKKQNQPKVNVVYEDENIAVLYKPLPFGCLVTAPAMQTLWTLYPVSVRKRQYDPHGEPVQARHLQPAGPRRERPCDRRQELHRPAGHERDHPH